MEYLSRAKSKIKEARGIFCLFVWKEIKLFSKTMLGKGELSEPRLLTINSGNCSRCFGDRKEKDSANRVLENWREIKYLHALIT